mgnify:CR=1 FL=1
MRRFLTLLTLGAAAVAFAAVPLPAVFDGAAWIGAPAGEQPLVPERLTVFRIGFDISLQPAASATFLYGVDDPRLMDANFNIYSISSPRDSSYIALHIAADSLRVCRRGYSLPDGPATVAAFPATGLHTDGTPNRVEIFTNYGDTEFRINGATVGRAGLNPVGNGADYIAFPSLSRIGVRVPQGGGAVFSRISVGHLREPAAELWSEPGPIRDTRMIDLPVRSMPELRTELMVPGDAAPASATMYVAARGIYDISVNGRRITQDYFAPGSTQYNRTHPYRSYDIASVLNPGRNTIAVSLGEGWWSGPSTFSGSNWNFFGDRQSLLAAIVLRDSVGAETRVVTSPDTWQVSTDGPRVAGSFFQGEIYDATRTAQTWHQAVEVPLEGTVCTSVGSWDDIRFVDAGPDRVMPVDTLMAVSMTEPRPGVYVYDMGQNCAAVPLLELRGLAPGTAVSMRYGEVLYPDMPQYAANRGMVMTENLRAAMNQDIYVASGAPVELFSPRFTLHGYRYIEITGTDAPLPLHAVRALPLSSIPRATASFECSDSLVNRLWKNIMWSTYSNFISIPTDCAQRNERLGWMGDISVFSPAAVKLGDVDALLRRYLASVRDCTSPEGRFPDVAPTGFGFGGMLWGSAGIVVPWEHYRRYADLEVLREHYPAMQRYIDYLFDHAVDPATGIIVQDRAWSDLGDWLSPVVERDDKSLLWECYLIYDLDIMRQVAALLGDAASAERYAALRDRRIDFFRRTYIAPDGTTIHSAFEPWLAGRPVDTQASYALPIAMGICRDQQFTDRFIATLERSDTTAAGAVCPPYSLMTGFIGTAWISKALSAAGRDDIAYRLLGSTSWPSWLYPVTQGATTIWERLDSYTHDKGFGTNNSMNSFNHYSFGSVADWLLTRSLGIDVDEADGTVSIAPHPDTTGALTWARGWIDLSHGRVSSGWSVSGGEVVYTVEVPSGVSAVFTPAGGRPRKIKSGKHTFRHKL